MAQWVNRLRNNNFVNLLPLPLLCEISGIVIIVICLLRNNYMPKYQYRPSLIITKLAKKYLSIPATKISSEVLSNGGTACAGISLGFLSQENCM